VDGRRMSLAAGSQMSPDSRSLRTVVSTQDRKESSGNEHRLKSSETLDSENDLKGCCWRRAASPVYGRKSRKRTMADPNGLCCKLIARQTFTVDFCTR